MSTTTSRSSCLTAPHPCAAGSPLVVTSTIAPEMPAIADGRRRRSAQGHSRDASAACPLRARRKEHPRVVTVTQRQTTKIPAGNGVSRWQRYSATDFPS
jgi:hypothetical protein